MHYFISAGEASGDLHASMLIRALQRQDDEARFTFLGGDLMADEAGCRPLIHYSQMAFMGFSEVLRHLPRIFGNLRQAKEALSKTRPDALILVDYPSFNLKLAAYAHSIGIRVFYFISPKVWAWKAWRVKKIRRYIEHIYSILPFEKAFYKLHGYERLTYVGNPTVAEVDARLSTLPSEVEFRERHGLTTDLRPIIALVPGSRRGEIRCNLPVMAEAVSSKAFEGYRPVIAAAPGIDTSLYGSISRYPIVKDDTFALMKHATAALVTSGTATLECALIGTPQVVCYRSNGSKLAYQLMSLLVKVNYIALPNLIVDRMIVPELILHQCTTDTVSDHLSSLLPRGSARQAQLDGYSRLRSILGTTDASIATATDIIARLSK